MKKNVPGVQFLRTIIILIILTAANFCVTAQSWQWGRRGGSSANGYNPTPYETITDMATDSRGNMYLLAILESSGAPTLGTTQLNNTNGGRDILLASFDCSGTLRWKKVIGGASDADRPHALHVDDMGHVYVTGSIYPSGTTAHFDADTSLPPSYNKTLFLAQYDTAGTFKWLRMPQPDTLSGVTSVLSTSYDLNSDASGNVYMLSYLNTGLLSGPGNFVVNTAGPYIMKYNAQGTLQQLIQPQTQWNFNSSGTSTEFGSIRMTRTASGKFILAGYINFGAPPYAYSFSMGGQQIQHTMFIGCFDAQGQFLWKKENTQSQGGGFYYKPLTDITGSIYLSGVAVAGDSFNNYAFTNTNMIAYAMPMLVKLDSTGNTQWIKTAVTNSSDYVSGIAARNGEIVMAGSYPGLVQWDATHQLSNPPNTGYDIFLTRFDMQSGTVMGIDSVKSPVTYNDYTSAITSDKNGNVFFGGFFSASLTIAGQQLTSAGGDYDFFVAKYGYPCGCTAPVAQFTASVNNHVLTVTYTGAVSVDSVRWNFGDGSSATGNSVNHTYTGGGSYSVCATAYNQCGLDDTCATVQVATGVANVNTLADVQVYPNPASGYIIINAGKDYDMLLLNTVGQLVLQQAVAAGKTMVNIASLPAGTYLLQLTDHSGARGVMRLVKE